MRIKKLDGNTLIIIAITAALIIALLVVFFVSKPEPEAPAPVVKKRGGPCPGETKTFTQDDPYMRGILPEGKKFKVIFNYYECNPIKRGDLVFWQMSQTMPPVVKIARGIAGDTYSLSKDNQFRAWNLKVNGDYIYSALDKKQKYFFGAPTPPPLARYHKTHKGKIQQGDVLLLSSWPPGSKDSGLFGMFSMQDVVGKVELIDEGNK